MRAHPVAAGYLAQGQAEASVIWDDPETGLRCKARPDWVTAEALIDLKTSAEIERRRFAASAARLLYHCQLAFYRAGLEAATGAEPAVKIIAVEAEPPHDVAVYELDEDALWAGRIQVGELLARIAECRASGLWPGRYPDEQRLGLPSWALPDEADELVLVGLKPAKGAAA